MAMVIEQIKLLNNSNPVQVECFEAWLPFDLSQYDQGAWASLQGLYMYRSPNFIKGVSYRGFYRGPLWAFIKGDSRSSDYDSYTDHSENLPCWPEVEEPAASRSSS